MNTAIDVINLIYGALAIFSVLTWSILIIKLYIFFRLKRANLIFLETYDKITHAADLPTMPKNVRGLYSRLAVAMQHRHLKWLEKVMMMSRFQTASKGGGV